MKKIDFEHVGTHDTCVIYTHTHVFALSKFATHTITCTRINGSENLVLYMRMLSTHWLCTQLYDPPPKSPVSPFPQTLPWSHEGILVIHISEAGRGPRWNFFVDSSVRSLWPCILPTTRTKRSFSTPRPPSAVLPTTSFFSTSGTPYTPFPILYKKTPILVQIQILRVGSGHPSSTPSK